MTDFIGVNATSKTNNQKFAPVIQANVPLIDIDKIEKLDNDDDSSDSMGALPVLDLNQIQNMDDSNSSSLSRQEKRQAAAGGAEEEYSEDGFEKQKAVNETPHQLLQQLKAKAELENLQYARLVHQAQMLQKKQSEEIKKQNINSPYLNDDKDENIEDSDENENYTEIDE